MTVPEARRHPALRRFPLRRLRLPLGGGTLPLVLPDAGAWLHRDGYGARAEAGDEPPYWADLWPAAVAVARWLSRRDLTGRRVLDLGCGVGLCGIAAARRGAAVTFADRAAEALAFARFNVERAAPAAPPAELIEFDWRARTLAGPFDVVCLADVTYRVAHHLPVLRQLRAALGNGGLVLHADPFRRESDGFLVLVRKEFAVVEEDVTAILGEQRVPVRLVRAARDAAVLQQWGGTGR